MHLLCTCHAHAMHMQVLANILVQRHTPWGSPKLTLARWLHNVVVTCMLVEAHPTARTLSPPQLHLHPALHSHPHPSIRASSRRTPPRRDHASSGGSSRACGTTTCTTATAAHPTSSSSATQQGQTLLPVGALELGCCASILRARLAATLWVGQHPQGTRLSPWAPIHRLACSVVESTAFEHPGHLDYALEWSGAARVLSGHQAPVTKRQ